MKKCIFSLMAVGLMATAANAATIGLRWSDTPDQKHLGPGTVEFYIQMLDGEGSAPGGALPADNVGRLAGAASDLFCLGGDCSNLTVTNPQQGTAPQWNAVLIGNGSIPGTTISAFTPSTGPNYLLGPQDVVLMTFDVGYTGSGTDEKSFGIDLLTNPGGGAIDEFAGSYVWDARYNTSFSGYIAYGDYGYVGWDAATKKGTHYGQPDSSALIITKVPEPSALALLALGGFALLRRR